MPEEAGDRETTATAGTGSEELGGGEAVAAAGDLSAGTRTAGPSRNGADGAGGMVTRDVSAETRAPSAAGDVSAETSGGAADGFTRVATLDQIPEGTLLGVEPDGHRICLANVEGEIYALQDNCSHQDFPLSAGVLEDGRVECAWHGAKFDPASGRAVALPAIRPVKTFAVRVDGDDILVDLG